jgi:hypothetical protein
MEAHTFGSSEAAVELAAMLTKYDRVASRKASKLYHTTNDLFLDVQLCKHRVRLMKLILAAQTNTVKESDLPEEVKNFLLNCISAQHRRYLKKSQ